MRWGDTNYAKGTEKSTSGAIHSRVIYGYNSVGEVVPPIYWFDSSSENSDNFQVKPTWVQGLPKVRGNYGFPTTKTYDSSVAVSKIVCTDEELMHKLIENFYLPLYTNFRSVKLRNDTGKFIFGPVILKTDSEQGRLTASFSCIALR